MPNLLAECQLPKKLSSTSSGETCHFAVTAKFPPVSTENGPSKNLINMLIVKISKSSGSGFFRPSQKNWCLLSQPCNFLLSWRLRWNMPLSKANFDHEDSMSWSTSNNSDCIGFLICLWCSVMGSQSHFGLRCENILMVKEMFHLPIWLEKMVILPTVISKQAGVGVQMQTFVIIAICWSDSSFFWLEK